MLYFVCNEQLNRSIYIEAIMAETEHWKGGIDPI